MSKIVKADPILDTFLGFSLKKNTNAMIAFDKVTQSVIDKIKKLERKEFNEEECDVFLNSHDYFTILYALEKYLSTVQKDLQITGKNGIKLSSQKDLENFCEDSGVPPMYFNEPVKISQGADCTLLFADCRSFNQPVSIPRGVKSCMGMFRDCVSFNSSVTISDSVEMCADMFQNCESFNQPVTLPKHLKYCTSMFEGCINFNQPLEIPIGVDLCHSMLTWCSRFNSEIIHNLSDRDYKDLFYGREQEDYEDE